MLADAELRKPGWGRYRRTAVRALPGSRGERAAFATALPAVDVWSTTCPGGPSSGVWRQAARRSVAFDAADADFGWNHLGDFDLAAGEARLAVSTAATGDPVIADAVRWRPAPVAIPSTPNAAQRAGEDR